jgi:uncharacterized membrane protein
MVTLTPRARPLPGMQATRGEPSWPASLAVVVAVVLQMVLPTRFALSPHWLLPALELVLLGAITQANPQRMRRDHPAARGGGLVLTGFLTAANGVSAALLVHAILYGTAGSNARELLGSGAAIYATNIITFALWYWEFDRGGPVSRSRGTRPYPDFLFPQMDAPQAAPADWSPAFVDYLYLSFTNATAFSPSDAVPLTRWAKLLLMTQSAVALFAVVLVVSRAINVLA